jgi:hypothetical protein
MPRPWRSSWPDLVAHDADVIGGGADEGDAVRFKDIGERAFSDRKP